MSLGGDGGVFFVVFLLWSGCNASPAPPTSASTMPGAACPSTETRVPPPSPAPGGPPAGLALRLEQIVAPGTSLDFPLYLTAPPGDDERLFVVEKRGLIRILDRATNVSIGTFLDLTGQVSTGGEQGLLGVAFDPHYATNRRFYVSYTDVTGMSVVARYLTDPMNPNIALTTVDRIIMTVDQPFANHNGGMIAFGPDNMLYLTFGDGGSGRDPGNRAKIQPNSSGKSFGSMSLKERRSPGQPMLRRRIIPVWDRAEHARKSGVSGFATPGDSALTG